MLAPFKIGLCHAYKNIGNDVPVIIQVLIWLNFSIKADPRAGRAIDN